MLRINDRRDNTYEYSEISEVIYGERKTKEEILSDTKEMKKENKAPVKKSVWVKPKSRVKT